MSNAPDTKNQSFNGLARSERHTRPSDLTDQVISLIAGFHMSPGGTSEGSAPLRPHGELRAAVARGIEYLLERQGADGHWEEYELPVGPSDAWVTAYVGLALAEAAQLLGVSGAAAAASRAAQWLLGHRPFEAGWGYSDQSGPDADSTAYALMLFAATGEQPDVRTVEWLSLHWRPDGGFATYLQQSAWGLAHPDVTPTAYSALPAERQAALAEPVLEYIERVRCPDETWQAYWWRACHYSTYWNLRVLRRLGQRLPQAPPSVLPRETRAVHTVFDLAFVTGVAHQQLGPCALTWALGAKLAQAQERVGQWPAGASLRLTNQTCSAPWDPSLGRGRLYVDTRSFITTASAIRVLSELLAHPSAS